MKHLAPLLILSIVFCFSCSSDDLCDRTVTYTKGQAVYGDLATYRNVTLNAAPRSLVEPGKIHVAEYIMLIVESETGIHVVDNTDPQQPQFVNFIQVPGIREMAVEGSTLYVDSYYDILEINIANPRSAVLVHRIEEAFPVQLFNEEGLPLVKFSFEEVTESVSCDSDIFNASVAWFDFNNQRIPESALPTSFVASGETFGTVNRMAITADRLFIIGNVDLTVINLEENTPQLEQSLEWFGNGMETIYPYDDHLFIGSRQSMSIYNLTSPANPQLVGNFWHATSCDPVLPTADDIAYVTLRDGDGCGEGENTLNIIDITSYNRPRLVEAITMTAPYAMTIHQDVLYVGEGVHGFSAFTIDGRRLEPLYQNTSITAYDIIAHPVRNDILLFAGPDGIFQYEVEGDHQKLLSEI